MARTGRSKVGVAGSGPALGIVDTFKRSSDEEDNICYVAATRAKNGLYLLGERKRFIEGPAPKGGDDYGFDDQN